MKSPKFALGMADPRYGCHVPLSTLRSKCNGIARECNGISSSHAENRDCVFNRDADAALQGDLTGPGQLLCNTGDGRKFALPDDGYVHLVAPGEFAQKTEGGKQIVQVFDAEGIASMAAAFDPSRPLLLNYEHRHVRSDDSRAGGWITALEARPDGLYGKVSWTAAGLKDIEGGEYRYISPEFTLNRAVALGGDRYRMQAILGAALTNTPNVRTLRPISEILNKLGAQPEPETKMNKILVSLIPFLGLAAGADEQAALNAIPADTTLAELLAAKDQNAVLNTEVTQLRSELADRDLDQFAAVINTDQREVVKQQLILNREATLKFLKAIKAPEGAGAPPAAVFNKGSATPPETDKALAAAASAEERKAAWIANRATELRKADPALTFNTSWQAAAAEYKG